MAFSLQQGINAAKAGRTQEALRFLKDAIIEEPQNADVWVWVAAIIDDLDKQEIFLEKALEIDPNNIPAQRGMAYLKKRKRDEASVNNEHLSDHTHPITPFPASRQATRQMLTSTWSQSSVDTLESIATEDDTRPEKKTPQRKTLQKLPKLTPFEISMLGVVVVVFCFIGLLVASALFDFQLPFLKALTGGDQARVTEPPYPGAFLFEDNVYQDIRQHVGLPSQDIGIPISTNANPMIVFFQSQIDPEQIQLIYETGDYISITYTTKKNETILIQPAGSLEPGLYCLQQPQPAPSSEPPSFWCFKVRPVVLED